MGKAADDSVLTARILMTQRRKGAEVEGISRLLGRKLESRRGCGFRLSPE